MIQSHLSRTALKFPFILQIRQLLSNSNPMMQSVSEFPQREKQGGSKLERIEDERDNDYRQINLYISCMYTNVLGGDLSYSYYYLQCGGRALVDENTNAYPSNHQPSLYQKCPAPNQWSVFMFSINDFNTTSVYLLVCLNGVYLDIENQARDPEKRLTSCIAISSTVFRVNLRLHKTNRSSRLGPSSSSTIALYRPPQIPKWYTRGTPSTKPINVLYM